MTQPFEPIKTRFYEQAPIGGITQTAVVNVFLVYLLLFVSGTWRYKLAPDKYLIIAFLVALVAWYLYSDRKISHKFLLYGVVFAGSLVALSLYTGGSLSLSSAISGTLKLVLAYLIIRTVGRNFVDTYIKVLVFLAAFSLFGYMTDILHLFEGVIRKLPPVGKMGYEGIFYLYRMPWHPDRNNSIFFEPGAYQAFLNAGMFLLAFNKTSFSERRIWIYIAILLMALVTTYSTTGILIFAFMFALFLFRSELLTVSGKAVVIGVIVALIAMLSTQFHSKIVLKLDEFMSTGEYATERSSGQIRSANISTDLKIFKKHVFGIGYKQYVKEFGIVGRYIEEGKDEGSTNGVTRTLAEMGLPFSLLIFGSYIWAFKRLLHDYFLAAGAFIMFMMFLAGESYYTSSPISYAIIVSAFIYQRAPLQEELEQTQTVAHG